jgi:hypothetical protein
MAMTRLHELEMHRQMLADSPAVSLAEGDQAEHAYNQASDKLRASREDAARAQQREVLASQKLFEAKLDKYDAELSLVSSEQDRDRWALERRVAGRTSNMEKLAAPTVGGGHGAVANSSDAVDAVIQRHQSRKHLVRTARAEAESKLTALEKEVRASLDVFSRTCHAFCKL